MRSAVQPIMDVNLKLLQTFLLVAEYSSFRQAADRTHRSQSAVSTQIRQLELQLGVALFHRTTRRVRLTSEGEQLVGSAERALREVELGLRKIQEAVDMRRGRISLSCSPTITSTRLPRILAAFEEDFPGVGVFVREVTSTALFESVGRGEVDFAVGPLIHSSEFAFEPILDDELYALVPRRFIAASRSSITLEALSRIPLLLLDAATALRAVLDETMKNRNLTFTTKHQFSQAQTLIKMAAAGLGAAVLPRMVLPRTPDPAVQALRIIAPTMTRQVAIITARGQALSPAASRLAQLFRQLIGTDDDATARRRAPKKV